ncbi:MAG: HEPN domain-containing protein [archaeon]
MRLETNNWISQAKIDLESAEINFKAERHYLSVFLCHQATEKALKALYIEKNKTSAGTTHSLIF